MDHEQQNAEENLATKCARHKIELDAEIVAFLKSCGTPHYCGPLQAGPGYKPSLVAQGGQTIPGRCQPKETFVTFSTNSANQHRGCEMARRIRDAGITVTRPHITLVGERAVEALEAHGIEVDRSNKRNRHVIRTR